MTRVGLVAATPILGAMLALAGCAVGPDFHRPKMDEGIPLVPEPLPAQTRSVDVQGGAAQRFTDESALGARWWTAFGSKPLDDLVDAALAKNKDLRAAEAALRAANEAAAAQRAAVFPTLSAQYLPSRQKTAPVLASPLSSNDLLYSLHTAQVSVAYTADVFGGTRRRIESAEALAEVQRFQREAAYVTLTSNVVVAAIQEASLREQVAATREIIASASRLGELTRKQHDAGQVGGVEVVAQEAALAQAEATLPPLEKQLALQRDLLAVLAGRYPGEGIDQHFELASLSLPGELPLSLPAQILEHRPDIRAAEAELHSASAQVGVAVAARLPAITIAASAGSSALEFAKLFASGTTFWSIAGSVSQTLIDGGALRHQQLAAEAILDQAGAQYESTVLTGFQNVADVLFAIKHDADALEATARAERATRRAMDLTERQWRAGASGFVAVLLAQQAHAQAAIALVQARAARYADAAALYQALGGGWWKRGE